MSRKFAPPLRLLALAVASTCTIASHNAWAQSAPAPKAEPKVDSVTVTGTRIKSPGVVSNSPITSVGTEEINSSQPVAVEEFIKLLPAAVPAIGPGTNNGGNGASTIDLRGLGSNRSLVLVDGRRMVPFDLNGQVDSNIIPLALLQRVDLVTGGASAVYGADAISGVINFVLKKNFKGIEAATSYGQSGKSDANRKRTDLTFGAGFDDGRGNVAMSVGFTETQPLRQDKRDIGLRSIASTTGLPQGSGTTVPAFINGPAPGPAGQINPQTGAIDSTVNTYNFNPDNYYQTPLKRKQLTAIGNYVINNHAEVYAQAMYTRSDVKLQLAPSGSFLNTYQVNIGNPYLPTAVRNQYCAAYNVPAAQCVVGNTTLVRMVIGRRFVELGPRLNPYETRTLQSTLGVKGDLVGNWTYDTYWSYGESDQTQRRVNWGSLSRLRQALQATSTTACINTDNNCVPLNIFGAAGSITPAMLGFINQSTIALTSVSQQVGSASISGDFGPAFKFPTAKSPIAMAFGVEYRKVDAGNVSDGPTQIQDEVLGAGAPTPDRSGKFTLKEYFAEANIPILSNLPFAKALNLELGVRRTEFTVADSRNYSTFKAGGDWEPVSGFRFRGMAQRATRAPNINELFAPQVTGLSNLATDPCQGNRINAAQATTAGTLSNLCRLTGVPVSQFGTLSAPSSGQINRLTRGDTTLGPEVADTKTIGFVWQPEFVKGLSFSLDYYEIKIKDALLAPSTTDVINNCYDPKFNPTFALNSACALVFRSPTTGTFNGDARGVQTFTTNSGKFSTNGFDLNVTYGFALKDLGLDAKLGRIDMSFTANRVGKYTVQPTPLSVDRDCLGFYSNACQENLGLTAKNKFSQRTNWTVGDFTVGYNWRYISGLKVEPGSGTWFAPFTSIPAYNYVDLSGVWNINKNTRINLSITNVADKKAPLVGNTIGTTGTNSGNTFPQNYDVIGRYFTLGATVRF